METHLRLRAKVVAIEFSEPIVDQSAHIIPFNEFTENVLAEALEDCYKRIEEIYT